MDDDDAQRRRRAEERAARIVSRRARTGEVGSDLSRVEGPEAVALAWRLTCEARALTGRPCPSYERADTPDRFVPGRPT